MRKNDTMQFDSLATESPKQFGDIPAIRNELKGYVESDLPSPDVEIVNQSIEDAKAGRVSTIDEILEDTMIPHDGIDLPILGQGAECTSCAAMIRDLLEVNDEYKPGEKPYVNLEITSQFRDSNEFIVIICAEWNDWRSLRFIADSLHGALRLACEEKAKRKAASAAS